MSITMVVEKAECMTDNGIPVIVLRHGLKDPLSGVDGSWLILTDPDDVAPVIQRVSRTTFPNLGVMLATKSDSPLVVVDVDGDGAWEQLKRLGSQVPVPCGS